MKKYFIAASRGRDSCGGGWTQRLEISTDGCSHAITSVAKDNYIIEYEEKTDLLSDTNKLPT